MERASCRRARRAYARSCVRTRCGGSQADLLIGRWLWRGCVALCYTSQCRECPLCACPLCGCTFATVSRGSFGKRRAREYLHTRRHAMHTGHAHSTCKWTLMCACTCIFTCTCVHVLQCALEPGGEECHIRCACVCTCTYVHACVHLLQCALEAGGEQCDVGHRDAVLAADHARVHPHHCQGAWERCEAEAKIGKRARVRPRPSASPRLPGDVGEVRG